MKGIKAVIRSNNYLKWLLIISNFVNSGIRGADTTERFFKILRIFIFFIIFYLLLTGLYDQSSIYIVAASFFLSYFSNWLFHFNLGTLKIHYLGYGEQKKKNYFNFITLINQLAKEKSKGILFIAAFGSTSRGKLHSRSDLDITVVRKEGFINAINAFYFIEKIRRLASNNLIPFDSALGDSIDFIKSKYRTDEPPVAIFDPYNIIDKHYSKKLTIPEARKLNGL